MNTDFKKGGKDMGFEGKHTDLTAKIIGAFYTVYNHLGYGFSEKVYIRKVFDNQRKGSFSWSAYEKPLGHSS